MKIKILIISAFVLFTALFSICADSYWEGAASMSRYGEFPVKGFYGASNSFPLNSIVEVNNPSQNKKVEIIIVNKLDDNNLFILLSKDASEKLSINEDQIVSVKAKVVKQFMPDGGEEKELTEDPDYNPVKSMNEEKVFVEDIPEPEPEVEYIAEKDLADEIIETIIFSDILMNEPEEIEETTDEEIEDTDGFDGPEVIITEIIEPEPVEEAAEIEEVLEETAEEEELFEMYDPDAVIAVPADEAAEEATDEALEYEEKLVLVPSGPKPPENVYSAPAELPETYTEESSSEESSSDEMNSVSEKGNLDSNSFYLQIGAFKEYSAADSLIKNIEIDYPVFLYTRGGNGIYRVMAGPLKQDEKGAALYQVRIKGMKDAFIRKGE